MSCFHGFLGSLPCYDSFFYFRLDLNIFKQITCMAASRCFRSCAAWPSSKCTYKLSSLIGRPPRREFREFFDDSGSLSSRKMSTDEVNRRIFESEFFCYPDDHKVGFTANQVSLFIASI